jgi:hypothetical protein
MSGHQVFNHDDERQEYDQRRARLEHGPDLVDESMQRWKNYTEEQREGIIAEGNAIYADIAKAMTEGHAANAPEVQEMLERWHQHIRYFYEPTLEILQGLGETYALHPEFRANFEKLHPDLPDFLREAVAEYVDVLETKTLEKMLAEDEERLNRLQQRKS